MFQRRFKIECMLILFAFATAASYAQTGLIRGTVLDADGNPVAKADAYAMFFLHYKVPNEAAKAKIESGERDGFPDYIPWDGRVDATTDGAGGFELQGLQWGVYELGTQKVEDGYRSTFRNLFTGEPAARVVLSPTSPYAQVILRFPPKCALLTGIVKNAKTGEQLSSVELHMHPKENLGYYEVIGTSVPFHELIPSEREFTLEIVAHGYETWVYRNGPDEIPASNAPAASLDLQPGEELHVQIALTPQSAPVRSAPQLSEIKSTDAHNSDEPYHAPGK